MTELERCVDFVYGIAKRAATTTVPSPYGVAYLALDVPNVWSRNYLLATENLDGVTAPDLAAEADRIMGAAGLGHRKVEVVDADAGDRLADGFRELGWNQECDVIMVSAREPDREVDTSSVEEVTVDELVPAWSGGWSADPDVLTDAVVRQLIENKRGLSDVVDTRFFAARVDGEIASYCELYSDGATAQIENVLTLERFRNRGLARATVSHARAEAQRTGHDLIFLIADRDDWPRKLYAKLGFDEMGRLWEFVRPRAA
jgi:ribosomal protein S18 acetylase RimI-like enzyme